MKNLKCHICNFPLKLFKNKYDCDNFDCHSMSRRCEIAFDRNKIIEYSIFFPNSNLTIMSRDAIVFDNVNFPANSYLIKNVYDEILTIPKFYPILPDSFESDALNNIKILQSLIIFK